MVPERYPELIARAAEYGNNRILDRCRFISVGITILGYMLERCRLSTETGLSLAPVGPSGTTSYSYCR